MRRWIFASSLLLALGCADDARETSETSGAAGSTGGAATAGVGGDGGAGVGGGSAGSGGEGGRATPCTVESARGACIDVSACEGGVAVPGYCPGPAEIQCCIHDAITCDPEVMVQPNGGLEEAPGEGGCPAGMLPVDAFCVDRYEASLVELDGTPWSPYFNPGSTEVRAVSIAGAVPQGYISGVQAALACEASGKRLCTDAEWLRACQGPAGTTYPYGDTVMPGVCNDARDVHPAIEYFGTSDDWIWSELDNACLDQLHDSLDPAGANPGCVTAEGAFDMMGNLHEWTSDPAGTFRGGYYVDTKLNGPGCLYATTAHDTSHWDYSTGFRCCADPP